MKKLSIIFIVLLSVSFASAHQKLEHSDRSPSQLETNHIDVFRQYDSNNTQTVEMQEVLNAIDDKNNGELEEYKVKAFTEAYNKEIQWEQQRVIEANTGSAITVNVGDKVVFGPNNQNNFVFKEIGSPGNTPIVTLKPNTAVEGTYDNTLDIVVTETASFNDLKFKTGKYRISVERLKEGQKKAMISIQKIYRSTLTGQKAPVTKETANNLCGRQNQKENVYYFCKGDAHKEVSLGPQKTKEFTLEYNANQSQGINSIFTTETSDGSTLTLTAGKDRLSYKGAEIKREKYTGLLSNHEGDGFYQAKLKVNPPEKKPEASLSFGSSTYETGNQPQLDLTITEPGNYRLEIQGTGIDRTINYDEEVSETIPLDPTEKGEITAKIIAQSSWWNVLNSDTVVDEATTQVEGLNYDIKGYSLGETVDVAPGEGLEFEGQKIYMKDIDEFQEGAFRLDAYAGGPNAKEGRYFAVIYDQGQRTSTVEEIGSTEYAIAACRISQDQATITVEKTSRTTFQWPDSWCDGTRPQKKGDIIQYRLGKTVNVSKGDSLVFGNDVININKFVDSGSENVVAADTGTGSKATISPRIPTLVETTSGTYYTKACNLDMASKEAQVIVDENREINCPVDISNIPATPVGKLFNVSSGDIYSIGPNGDQFFEVQDINPVDVSGKTRTKINILANRRTETASGEKLFSAIGPYEGSRRFGGMEYFFKVCSSTGTEASILVSPNSSASCWNVPEDKPGTAINSSGAQSYSLGEPVALSEGDKIKFNGHIIKVSQVKEIDGKPVMETWVDRKVPMKPGQMDAYDKHSISATAKKRTVQKIENRYAVGGCSMKPGQNKGTIIIQNESTRTNSMEWPENVCSQQKEKNGKIRINSPKDPQKGKTHSIIIEVPDSKLQRYQAIITDPEGQNIVEETYSSNQNTLRASLDKTGKYTVKIYPTGTLQSVINLITGPSKEKPFTVSDQATWKSYCSDKGFSTQTVNEKISCMENEIVPNCFNQSAGTRCRRVAQDVCNELLDYSYSTQKAKCVPR